MSDLETQERPAPPGRRTRALRVGEFGWIWFGLAAVFLFSAAVAPGTLRLSVFTAMLSFAAVLAIAAAGQTLVIQQRGLDLSLPGTMSLCALMMARNETAHGVVFGVLVTLAVAVVIGTANGLVVTRLAITPLVATLAINSLIVGGVYTYSHGLPIATSPSLTRFARASHLGLPTMAIVALLTVALLALIAHKTVAGRRFTVVGASASTARAAGIHVTRYQVSAYIGSSIFAGLAGVLLAAFTGSATSDLGTTYLLSAIAAVVVGGTPLTGGRGSVIATAAAALFLSQLGQVTLALGAPTSTQLFVQAGALVLATAMRYLRLGSLVRLRRPSRPTAGFSEVTE